MDDIFNQELARRAAANTAKPVESQTYDTLEKEIGSMFSGEHTRTRGLLVQKINKLQYSIKMQRKRLPRLKGAQQEKVRAIIKKHQRRIVVLEDEIKGLSIPENFKE